MVMVVREQSRCRLGTTKHTAESARLRLARYREQQDESSKR
jgi:hypothetical protein